MQNQKRHIEYIDEYRKISTIQKLPAIQNNFMSIFQQQDKDNSNKFIRLRKQPNFQLSAANNNNNKINNSSNQTNINNNIILHNSFIQGTVNNRLSQQKQQYRKKDQIINTDIQKYREFSKYNRSIERQGGQLFKYYYGEAKCPNKINEQSIGKEAYNIKNIMDLAGGNQYQIGDNNEVKNNSDNYNLGENNLNGGLNSNDKSLLGFKLPNTQYNFNAINQMRWFEQQNQVINKLELNQAEQNLNTILHLKKYTKFRDLKTIDKIQESKMLYQGFSYSLKKQKQDQKLTEKFLKKFIYKSILRQNFDKDLEIEYFRDIGLPSWNIAKFTSIYLQQKPNKQWLEQNSKQQPHLLHLLRQKQLNIKKKNLSFDDIANISTARILSSNAYLCIRSQKITRAQFQRLLKRLDKYKVQQRQRGKKKTDQGTQTLDIQHQQDNLNQNVSKLQSSKGVPQYMMIISQIMKLRGQSEKLRNAQKNADLITNKSLFQKQNIQRMRKLLNSLYNLICVDPFTFPLINIENYIHEPEKILKKQYSNQKFLWLIIECLQDSTKKIKKQDNLINLIITKDQQPTLYKYRGSKLLKQSKLAQKNLYTWRQKKSGKQQKRVVTPAKNRKQLSRSPLATINETAYKLIQRQHTPSKQTARKDNYSRTPTKQPIKQYGEKTKRKPFY